MWRNDELPEPEIFTPERIAEFLLNNSLTEEEYRRNLREVIAMGIDPLAIDPAALSHFDPWAGPEKHPDILLTRRTS